MMDELRRMLTWHPDEAWARANGVSETLPMHDCGHRDAGHATDPRTGIRLCIACHNHQMELGVRA